MKIDTNLHIDREAIKNLKVDKEAILRPNAPKIQQQEIQPPKIVVKPDKKEKLTHSDAYRQNKLNQLLADLLFNRPAAPNSINFRRAF